MTELDILKEQHVNNYKNAVLEIIKNNTNSLVDDDIMSLINKPPLDSMDVLKGKCLSIAKRENIVVNTDQMNRIIDFYRQEIQKEICFVKRIRIHELSKNVTNFQEQDHYEVIRITKKQLSEINKKINSQLKKLLEKQIEKLLIDQIDTIFVGDLSEGQNKQTSLELTKFFKSNYKKQLIENINFKILVKDTTLISGVKEQGERYIFTKTNSRIHQIEETKK